MFPGPSLQRNGNCPFPIAHLCGTTCSSSNRPKQKDVASQHAALKPLICSPDGHRILWRYRTFQNLVACRADLLLWGSSLDLVPQPSLFCCHTNVQAICYARWQEFNSILQSMSLRMPYGQGSVALWQILTTSLHTAAHSMAISLNKRTSTV